MIGNTDRLWGMCVKCHTALTQARIHMFVLSITPENSFFWAMKKNCCGIFTLDFDFDTTPIEYYF